MPSYTEDGHVGPSVERVSVVVEDFVVGQERRSESLEIQQRKTLKDASEKQVTGSGHGYHLLEFSPGSFVPCPSDSR